MIKTDIKPIKLFHLVKDTTSNVAEKVFLLENKIQAIQGSFRTDSKVVGLMGPLSEIHSYLYKVQCQKNKVK